MGFFSLGGATDPSLGQRIDAVATSVTLHQADNIKHKQSSGTTQLSLANAEGDSTTASGDGSHAEGYATYATGDYAHAEGEGSSAEGYGSHAEGSTTYATGDGSHAEGQESEASGANSHAEGRVTSAGGNNSHSEGMGSDASGVNSHAEGDYTTANTQDSHAEGNCSSAIEGFSYRVLTISGQVLTLDNTPSGWSTGNVIYGYAQGLGVRPLKMTITNVSTNQVTVNISGLTGVTHVIKPSSSYSATHAEGSGSVASGVASHAEGNSTLASGYNSHAEGYNTTAGVYASHAQGRCNKLLTGVQDSYSGTADAFVIGNGASLASKSNAFRVTFDGKTYGLSAFNSTGADYAEFFEWKDGNISNEDRVGYFVTLNGEKIRKATSTDDYILGIISATPSIVGDNYADDWNGKYVTDDWGRIQYHEIDIDEVTDTRLIPAVLDTEGNIITPEVTETITIVPAQKSTVPMLNPDWNSELVYIPREKRPEWSAIGIMGKLKVRDDGTCIVGGYCKSNDDGIATLSTMGYRVIKRVADNIVLVLVK